MAGRVNDLDFMLAANAGATAHLPLDRFPNPTALLQSGGAGQDAPPESADGTRALMLTALGAHFVESAHDTR